MVSFRLCTVYIMKPSEIAPKELESDLGAGKKLRKSRSPPDSLRDLGFSLSKSFSRRLGICFPTNLVDLERFSRFGSQISEKSKILG